MRTEQLKTYKKLREIGSGSYGSVDLIEDLRDRRLYALKRMAINVSSIRAKQASISQRFAKLRF